jgi:hypothetical protein
MKALVFLNHRITCEMNPPIFSEGGLKEDFNYSLKPAYMTL